jgi:hypothetical protein
MRRQRGGFWPFKSSDEKEQVQEEPVVKKEEESEETGEAGGFLSRLFGTSTKSANSATPVDVPEIDMGEPTGTSLSEEMQAGGAKKRKHRMTRKHRKSHKSRKVRKSHTKSRTRKSMKSKKH